MKFSFTRLFLFVLMGWGIATLYSCANIIPPGGGLRDSLPPRLVLSLPKDSATRVNTHQITLTFDEYVTLQNPVENLIISPTISSTPLLDYKLRNVTLKIKDTLEPNTTYSFDFGESIRDVNEGNIARNITYVISTGDRIDDNSYSGRVILAESGRIDSSLLVVLHNNLSDTAIKKIRPRYYTRLNGKGEFRFRFLPQGDFAVYVIEGTGNFMRRYNDSTRLFAFKNKPVTISRNTAPDTLYAFQEFRPKDKSIGVSGPIRPSANAKEDKRLKYGTDLENGQQDLLTDLTLNFNRKLSSFDSSGFVLYDTAYHKLTGYRFQLDTSKTKVILSYKWKEATALRAIISKEAVADSAGITLAKADTLRFITKREADYGSIRIRFANIDMAGSPVLQIVNGDKIVESIALSQPEFMRKLYKPGSYDLRILYDTNKNGVWDTGHFGTKQQPEKVQRISKQITIRGNWDNEVNVSL